MSFFSDFPPAVIQPWLDKAPKFAIDVIPTSMHFTDSEAGQQPEKQSVVIHNKGYADLPISKIHGMVNFIFSPVGDSTVIEAGKSLEIEVLYRPSSLSTDQFETLRVEFGCGVPLVALVLLTVAPP